MGKQSLMVMIDPTIDYLTVDEIRMKTGVDPEDFAMVILKDRLDNHISAAEKDLEPRVYIYVTDNAKHRPTPIRLNIAQKAKCIPAIKFLKQLQACAVRLSSPTGRNLRNPSASLETIRRPQ